jgi:4-diphosphocytidyl-2-C-methyl-D-erythritol kinase
LSFALPARAKLNLDLQVVGRRADGFHEIRTVMQAIDLHDVVEIKKSAGTTLVTSGLIVPAGSDNLVLKAVAALEDATGRALPCEIGLHKRIPAGAGLGGASSDAAATLRLLQSMHRLDVDLLRVAAKVGADVPFFIAGGAALAEGTGDRLTHLPNEPGWFAVAWPGIELSTAAVYAAWDELKGEPPNELRRAAEHVDPRVRDFAARLGHRWQMTGSGSAFFCRCADRDAGRRLVESLDTWAAVAHSVGAWA